VNQTRRRGSVVVLISLAMLATACGSSSKKPSSTSNANATGTTIAAKQGGDIVISAEQEPDCMDWLDACASAAWGIWSTEATTLIGAYNFTDKSTYVPSPLLTGPATLVTSPNQVVTYHINPKAVWSDGQPVTSTDFKYTWNEAVTGKNIFSTTGYINISGVDDTDPHTAVVTFKQGFADWPALFDTGTMPLMPSHILQGKNRDAIMKNGYTFSDGPWMLDHWTKGVEIKLVPNPMYWDKKPNLSSITFKFITVTASEQQAIKTGQVDAAYPQVTPGPQPLRGLPGIELTIKISGVKWTQTAKVIRRGNAVVLEVMTKAGRLYRSTSFRLTKKEAAKLAAELQKAASSN
jgi:peptide/nickel transport system substrate-binding protein